MIPIPGQKAKIATGLKRFFYIKPILLISVWTYLTLFLPALENQQFNISQLFWLTLIWISWILANTVLFDIRDISEDRKQNLQTLANLLGKSRSHRLIYAILLVQTILIITYCMIEQSIQIAPILCSVTIGYFIFNIYYSSHRNLKPHSFLIADLILILPLLFLLIPYFSNQQGI